jgi:hypothetical protein
MPHRVPDPDSSYTAPLGLLTVRAPADLLGRSLIPAQPPRQVAKTHPRRLLTEGAHSGMTFLSGRRRSRIGVALLLSETKDHNHAPG